MAHKCNKCGGAGFIKKFSGIANGECFRCMGTGRTLTLAERARIERDRANSYDAKMAKQQGVSLETFQAYVGAGPVPKHPNGISYSIQEFDAWRRAAA